MNQPDSEAARDDERFTVMLGKPPLLPDPVFPRENYLQAFGMGFFQMLLKQWEKPELIPQITANGATRQAVMLKAGWLGFWAFAFAEKSDQGLSGRDEFLDRVKLPIRRPPPQMAAFAAEQHRIARGVLQIQIADGEALPGEFQVCQLETIGWYAAQIVLPKG